jgi:hypothetical protein
VAREAGQSGHLFQGLRHGLGADVPRVGPSGFQPGGPSQQTDAARHACGGPHQQIDCGRLEDLGSIDPDGFERGFEVGLNLLAGPGAEQVMSAEPGTKRPVIAQLELSRSCPNKYSSPIKISAKVGWLGRLSPNNRRNSSRVPCVEFWASSITMTSVWRSCSDR